MRRPKKKVDALCPECKKERIKSPAKRCLQCYMERRGMPSIAKPKPTCVECGAVVSKAAKRCQKCWDGRRGVPLRRAKALALESLHEPLQSFEAAYKRWDKAIGKMHDRYKGPPKKPKGRERFVVIPDIHAPFHREEQLAHICAVEGPKATKAILLGDVADAYSFSTFTKYERVPFADEWAAVELVLQSVSEAFHEVEIIVGNHDERLEKRVRERLTEDMVDAVRYLTGGTLNPLVALAKRYPNVSIAKHETQDGATVDWFTTEGDCWLGHPQSFSRVAGSALRRVEDYISDYEAALNLQRYRLVIIGHTHQLSAIPYRSGQLLVEGGSICRTQGYQLSPRLGGRPQKNAYVWFEQDAGKTDLNSFGWHWFDVA